MTAATAGTTRELAKARRLAGFQDGEPPEEVRRITDREPEVRDLLPGV